MARRYDSEDARRRILSACVRLFIEKGYSRTKVAEILREADVSASTFQNIFRSKDGVLMELVQFMFGSQFDLARLAVGEAGPEVLYAVETAIQLTLTELNENLREIYLEAYAFPPTRELINQKTAEELYRLFGAYRQDCAESDFYELEIGTAGMMGGYMARPCDKYFTLERKLERFLTLSLEVYRVPPERRAAAVAFVLGLDIRHIATQVMEKLFAALAMHFDFTLPGVPGAAVEQEARD